MKSIEATGKTVNDAIKSGLEQLGVSRDDVEIQVIEMGSPGIFGMFGKRAKVRLSVKADEEAGIEMPVLSLDGGKAQKSRPEKKPEAPAEAEAEDNSGEPKPKKRRNRRRKGGAERAETVDYTPEDESEVSAPIIIEQTPFVPTDEASLSEDAKLARDFLNGLTSRMGVPVTLETMETPEQLRMQMAGENMSLLIGRRGETLDALQYLTSLTVNRRREDYLRISIDTENYRAKREEALRKLAVRMANKAKKSGRRVALEPMNPYERRILHSALQNDPEVSTHSEGEEPYRRVIITLNR